MVILVEGNEGTGKTKLIDALEEHLVFVRVKYNKNFQGAYEMFKDMAQSYDLYIVDRGFISDMVYRAIDREPAHICLDEIARLCHQPIKIVFCFNDEAFNNAMIRGETNITDKKLHSRIDEYFNFTKQLLRLFTPVEITTYNWEYDDVTDIVKFIKGGEV